MALVKAIDDPTRPKPAPVEIAVPVATQPVIDPPIEPVEIATPKDAIKEPQDRGPGRPRKVN